MWYRVHQMGQHQEDLIPGEEIQFQPCLSFDMNKQRTQTRSPIMPYFFYRLNTIALSRRGEYRSNSEELHMQRCLRSGDTVPTLSVPQLEQ